MYEALKTEHDLVLKKSTIVLKDALKRLEGKDAEIAKVKAQLKAKNDDLADAEREAYLAYNCSKYFKGQFEAKDAELTKYIKDLATRQEMKEMERRAREDEDEDDDRPLVSYLSKPRVINVEIDRDWSKEGYCPLCFVNINKNYASVTFVPSSK